MDTAKYILKDIFICIIKVQCSDQEERKWKPYKGCQINVNDGLRQIKWLHIVDTPMAKWVSMERQQSINDSWSCILGYLGGNLLQIVINEVLAALIGKRESQMLPAPSWKWMST